MGKDKWMFTQQSVKEVKVMVARLMSGPFCCGIICEESHSKLIEVKKKKKLKS